jgi:hypothetical protein
MVGTLPTTPRKVKLGRAEGKSRCFREHHPSGYRYSAGGLRWRAAHQDAITRKNVIAFEM